MTRLVILAGLVVTVLAAPGFAGDEGAVQKEPAQESRDPGVRAEAVADGIVRAHRSGDVGGVRSGISALAHLTFFFRATDKSKDLVAPLVEILADTVVYDDTVQGLVAYILV